MASTAQRRIAKELRDLSNNPIEGITIHPQEDNLAHWDVTITGPPSSPYKGGHFKATIDFPGNFPFKAPSLVFATKVYHPGINEQGEICVPILRDEWKPTISMSTVLNIVYEKLANPSPDDPYEADIAALLKSDEAKFKATAKEWTKKYAS
ncbi:related to UBC5-E2 ubiquitin-conjugating enzyme [Serendipita indica DSM 11827]|uniref:E2 ubiquitin-conjugating enzyme n=1 Tax=Serendipita indica (strain DSM 11827) TaxID=1109443 RepID=G4TES4_SERID|nr:related to UBC5-E2 ubiquitin-conjugating enzyme [Serendipita indica DSM 11827]